MAATPTPKPAVVAECRGYDGRYDGAAEQHQWTMATHGLAEKKQKMKDRRERAHRKLAKQKAENKAADVVSEMARFGRG